MWNDPYFETLKKDEKFLFMYLMTNPTTTLSGIYEFSLKRAIADTDIPRKELIRILKKLNNDRRIVYAIKTQEIFMVNWLKYNFSKSPKTMVRVVNEWKGTKSRVIKRLYLSKLVYEGLLTIDQINVHFDKSFTQTIADDDIERFEPLNLGEEIETIEQKERETAVVEKIAKKRPKTKDEIKYEKRMKENIKAMEDPLNIKRGRYVFLNDIDFNSLCEKYGEPIVRQTIASIEFWLDQKTTEAEKFGYYVSYRSAIGSWIQNEVKRNPNFLDKGGSMNEVASM